MIVFWSSVSFDINLSIRERPSLTGAVRPRLPSEIRSIPGDEISYHCAAFARKNTKSCVRPVRRSDRGDVRNLPKLVGKIQDKYF